jgi:hypothetical protein
MIMSELNQEILQVLPVPAPMPPEQVSGVAIEQSSNAHPKRAVAGEHPAAGVIRGLCVVFIKRETYCRTD